MECEIAVRTLRTLVRFLELFSIVHFDRLILGARKYIFILHIPRTNLTID